MKLSSIALTGVAIFFASTIAIAQKRAALKPPAPPVNVRLSIPAEPPKPAEPPAPPAEIKTIPDFKEPPPPPEPPVPAIPPPPPPKTDLKV